MDVEFWGSSRFNSTTKHSTSMQAVRLSSAENHLILEGDDDVRACFLCPFCYVDIEVHVLCTHLQEEHCFDFKNAVCPVCAANLGKDMIGHFTVQHAHLLKRRRKSQRSGLWANSSAMLGKELRELSSFLRVGRGKTSDSATDPLLSPFLCSVTLSDTKDDQDISSSNNLSTTSDTNSMEAPTLDEIQEQEFKERSQRAEFFQQMILSTIF